MRSSRQLWDGIAWRLRTLSIRRATHSLRRRWRAARGLPPHKHIAICGFPRSGTSMFSNMMGATLEGFTFDRMSERRSVETLTCWGNHMSKRPLDILETSRFAAANVHGKDVIVLILIRDPRDVITSVHENVPDEYFLSYDVGCRVWGEYPNYQHAMDHVGLAEIFRAVQAARHDDSFASMLLRYEELVADPDAVEARLGERFGLSFTGRFSEFHQRRDRHVFRPHGTRPLDPSLVKWDKQVSRQWVSRWKAPEHRRRILAQFDDHPALLAMLRTLGYESDDAWFERFAAESAVLEGDRHAG